MAAFRLSCSSAATCGPRRARRRAAARSPRACTRRLRRYHHCTSVMVPATNRPNSDDHQVDRVADVQQQRVERDHHQDRGVLVEVLHRDRAPGADQVVAAVLQQRVHRHDEEAGQGADQHHQRHREPDVGARRSSRSRSGPWRCRAGSRAPSGRARTHSEASTAPTAMPTAVTPCRIAALGQVEAERGARPFDDDELQRRAGAPEQRGHRERDLAEPVLPQVHDAAREVASACRAGAPAAASAPRRCSGPSG